MTAEVNETGNCSLVPLFKSKIVYLEDESLNYTRLQN